MKTKRSQIMAEVDLDALNYDNRAAIEQQEKLGRQLTKEEYEKFRYSNMTTLPITKKLKYKNNHFYID